MNRSNFEHCCFMNRHSQHTIDALILKRWATTRVAPTSTFVTIRKTPKFPTKLCKGAKPTREIEDSRIVREDPVTGTERVRNPNPYRRLILQNRLYFRITIRRDAV